VAFVLPIREAIAQETKTPLLILFATVFFVLLLVCANVAGLQLARASSRANEMAVRTSLGATSLCITCQILIESLLLSLTGGALGLLFAQWLVDGLRSAAPEDLAFDATLHLDTTVLTDVCIPAHDRMRLERLCRYAGRPPLATERLSLLPDGRLLYRLKRRWRDGTSHMIFEPLELVEKLAALVPPPRFNLVRHYGVLAPSAAWRSLVIPESDISDPLTHPNCPAIKQLLSPDTGN
jgi:hypothetical protein